MLQMLKVALVCTHLSNIDKVYLAQIRVSEYVDVKKP